ncbi:helix-turn-helix domain-containing protein [Oscillospiraceae bacterium 38-13]
MSVYTFSEEEKAEINAAREKATFELALRRLEVLRLRAAKKSNAEITQAAGYHKSTITRISKLYKEKGIEAVLNESLTGKRKYDTSNREFTPEQIRELQEGYKNASKPHVARRFQALLLRSEGKTLREVADVTNFSMGNLSKLITAYRKYGVRAVHGKAQPARVFKHRFTAEQKHEIEKALKEATEARVIKRLKALRYRAEGKTIEEAATAVGLHPMTVMALVRKYQEQGLASIAKNRGNKGKPCWRYLSFEEESSVLEPFRSRAEQGQRIDISDIQTALESEIGHIVSETYVTEMLKKHGWVRCWMPPEAPKS